MAEPPESSNGDDALKARLNGETSKINWQELQRSYASGVVIVVAKELDLIEVACQFSLDNTAALEVWLTAGTVAKANEEQASLWYEKNVLVWAVVVAPWVLVQEQKT